MFFVLFKIIVVVLEAVVDLLIVLLGFLMSGIGIIFYWFLIFGAVVVKRLYVVYGVILSGILFVLNLL